jgi:hypothetical protein
MRFFSAQRVKNALKETKERGMFQPLEDIEVMLFSQSSGNS